MRFFLMLCFLPLPVIMAVMLCNEAKFKKNIVVGVTLPYEARENAEVQRALSRYKKGNIIVAIILVVSGLLCMLAKSDWRAVENLMVWLVPAIVLPYIPYVSCNKRLREIKLNNRWGRRDTNRVSIDTSVIAEQKWLSPLWFLAAAALAMLPLLWNPEFKAVYISYAVCILLLWLCYRFAYRNKAERVDGNSDLTSALTAIRKKNWNMVFLVAVYGMAAISISMSFELSPVLSCVLIIVITLMVSALAIYAEMKTRKVQEELCSDSGKDAYLDDDDKWLWGVLYYNLDDEKLIINSRIGTNTTINLAKPAGKVIAAISLAVLLATPFILPVTNAVGNKPPEFDLSSAELTARSGGTEYVIKLDEIESVELIEELPKSIVKVNGTNFENLLKGRFSADKIGSVYACLDPTSPPFLLIEGKDGDNFLLGSREEGVIQDLMDKIK